MQRWSPSFRRMLLQLHYTCASGSLTKEAGYDKKPFVAKIFLSPASLICIFSSLTALKLLSWFCLFSQLLSFFYQTKALHYYSGCSEEDLLPCARKLAALLQKTAVDNKLTVSPSRQL